MLSALFFYLFAAVMLGAAFMVVAARNPVHAVLFLILAFFNAAGLFVLLGAEFLAMTGRAARRARRPWLRRTSSTGRSHGCRSE